MLRNGLVTRPRCASCAEHGSAHVGRPAEYNRRKAEYAGRAYPCSRVANRAGTSRGEHGDMNMRISLIAVGVAALLPSLSLAATTTAPTIVKAKKIIAAEMVDPSSLQFRKLRVTHGVVQGKALTITCGEYNARNKMGGYTGFARFAYEPTVMRGVISFNAEGGMDLFGDLDHSATATETNARILAVCLGVPQ